MDIDLDQLNSTLLKSGGYKEVLPEFYALQSIEEHGSWHNHQNVFEHVLAVFEAFEHFLSDPLLSEGQKTRLMSYLATKIDNHSRLELLKAIVLLHDIAKPETLTTDGERAFCPGHEEKGANRVEEFVERFGLSDPEYKFVEKVVRFHGKAHDVVTELLALEEQAMLPLLIEKLPELDDGLIEMMLLIWADVTGSDLDQSNKLEYDRRLYCCRVVLAGLVDNL